MITELSNKNPAFSKLINDLESKAISFEEIRLIDEIINKADDKLMDQIGSNLETFLSVVKTNSGVKGMKWDDLVIRFDWVFEK
jgi:hypothetical protein